ncbi:MAG: hypothetical protein M1827_002844 [Pycnora praestabilis]|nr:MAG: hypothetical protein M1827_002844 [Pycnora praestabilis]
MALSRPISLRALNRMATGSRRELHITGAASTHSSILGSERKLTVSGGKNELLEGQTNDDITRSRNFSTITNQDAKRPEAVQNVPNIQPSRTFNTSRALKTVKDTSFIDLTFLPRFEPEAQKHDSLRVPLLPDNFSLGAYQHPKEAEEAVIRPEISTASHESTHISAPSALSDVLDNASIHFDPYNLPEHVYVAASKITSTPVQKLKENGFMSELWTGLLDDVFGKKVTKP